MSRGSARPKSAEPTLRGLATGRWIRPVAAGAGARGPRTDVRVDRSGWGRALLEEARQRVGDLSAAGRRLEDRIQSRWQEATDMVEKRRSEVETELAARLRDIERECEQARQQAEGSGRTAGFADGFAQGRDEGFQRGLEEGREEGREIGRDEGLQAARGEVARAVAAMVAAGSLIAGDRARLRQEAREGVAALALAIARRVVRREIALDDRVVLRAVESAVELIFRRGRLVVQVHPADVAQVERALAEEPRWAEGFDTVEVSSTGDVDLGGCRLFSATGEIDLTVETQLEQIDAALRSAARLPEAGVERDEHGEEVT